MPQKVWAVGEEALAADFNTYLQQQVVATFANVAGRDAWAAPPNGALCITLDTNTTWIRVAGAWQLYKPFNAPACRAYHNTTQSWGDNTEASIAFNAERYDTDNMHDPAVNNHRITINTAGLYVVGFLIEIAAANDYALCYAGLRLNGTTSIGEAVSFATTAAANVHLAATTIYKFAAGDWIEVRVLQDNTANVARNIMSAPNRSPEFWAAWVGLG